jgi:eukaryotic-like serine/threonine-protein kinase
MRVILDVLEGPRKGRSFIFERHDTFIVGRSRFVHCPMPEDMALSRDHFMIEINPPLCELRDLGSTNGTFVNNHRVERVRLTSGDMIAAGQSVFRVRVETELSQSSGDDLPGGPRTETVLRGAIRCAGCGAPAPANLTVAGATAGASGEAIEWWCALCRSEAGALPQPVPYYTTLRELGRGAMGVVYQARHNLTMQMVALKLIMPETATTRAAIDRFQREMSVISQLRHPNIVEWYEQGMTRGQFWFAMEYVAGTNLETLAKAEPGRYPVNQACRLTCQILKGLEQAHQLGFVHRDIKPENILIAQNPEGPVGKISDFGLAKSFRGVGLSGLTFSGEMRGTVPFMPPEQMLDFKTVTPVADLYATAATLYYLLTCQYVYDEPTAGGDLIRMLLEEPIIPIQDRRGDVPEGLAKVIETCLARDPKARFPDATSMRRALKAFC